MEHARLSKLIPHGNSGVRSTPEGREIYYHGNSSANQQFDQLEVGTEATFA